LAHLGHPHPQLWFTIPTFHYSFSSHASIQSASCPNWLNFYPAERDSMLLQNDDIHLSDYNVSLPRTQYKSAALFIMFYIHKCFLKINQCPSSPTKQQSPKRVRIGKGCIKCIYNRTVSLCYRRGNPVLITGHKYSNNIYDFYSGDTWFKSQSHNWQLWDFLWYLPQSLL
jgi:hypothetical protein